MIDFRDKTKTKKYNYMLRTDQGSKYVWMSFQNNWTNSENCMTGLSMFIDFWCFFAYDWNSIQNHVFYKFCIVCMSGTYQTQDIMFPREEF